MLPYGFSNSMLCCSVGLTQLSAARAPPQNLMRARCSRLKVEANDDIIKYVCFARVQLHPEATSITRLRVTNTPFNSTDYTCCVTFSFPTSTLFLLFQFSTMTSFYTSANSCSESSSQWFFLFFIEVKQLLLTDIFHFHKLSER